MHKPLEVSRPSRWCYIKLVVIDDVGRAQGHIQLWSRAMCSRPAVSRESEGTGEIVEVKLVQDTPCNLGLRSEFRLPEGRMGGKSLRAGSQGPFL